jgi:type IV pilus biogenesis protein CpaD/CtpE
MTKMQRTAVGGFLSRYDRSAGPDLTILSPHGSYNEHAASVAAT